MDSAARIAFVAPFGFGQKTTVWARTLPLARQLAQQGHAVTLIIPPWDTPADAGKRADDAGVTVVQVSLRGGLSATLWRMVRQLDAFAPDIVHIIKPRAHAGIVQWVLWQRRRWRGSTGRPLLCLDIDDWEQAWAPINRYPWPVARFLAWQEEWGIRHADAISAASHWLAARAHAYAPQTPALYLPNGVDEPQVVAPRAQPAGPRILYYTRFVEVAPAWLAAFWRALHAQRPDAHLDVAGAPLQPGRERAFQRAMSEAGAAAAQQVTWHGFVDQAQQSALYAVAACAIFPAENVPLQQAKCSVRLATTLLHGVPVVAAAVGEQAHYGAAGAARLVGADATPADFAQAVAALLDDRAAQAAMIEQARRRLRAEYAWPALAAKLTCFYAAQGNATE
ncbi:MAG: glycosyltransferase family 4 protein [Caldilineaceae bacterium]|nr:glycosyltransferase family 4 protein [Caldilineaceae bacterium]